MKTIAGWIAAAALASAAHAQLTGGWIVEVDYMPGSGDAVSPSHPFALVRILATHGGGSFAFARGELDLIAGDGDWSWNGEIGEPGRSLWELYTPPGDPFAGVVNPRPDRVLKQVQDPLTNPIMASGGILVGTDVEGIFLGQLGPPFFNPRTGTMPVWEAAWTPYGFAPQSVPLETITNRYTVFESAAGPETPVPNPIEGSAVIRVVPSPPAAALGALGGLWVMRRRR